MCVQGFAYFTANFSWTSGSPNHQVTRLNFTSDTSGETGWKDRASSTVFAGLSDVILGNLSIDTEDHLRLKSKGNIMITGLRGCDEIARNYWLNKTIPDPPKLIAPFLMGNPGMSASFPSNPWLCRNKTLPLALEDLSNNVTMSLLGSELTYVALFLPFCQIQRNLLNKLTVDKTKR